MQRKQYLQPEGTGEKASGMQPMDSAMLSQPLQVMEDVMLSEFMQPMEGEMLSELASHIVNLTFYCKVLEAARSFSCSNASHSSGMSV